MNRQGTIPGDGGPRRAGGGRRRSGLLRTGLAVAAALLASAAGSEAGRAAGAADAGPNANTATAGPGAEGAGSGRDLSASSVGSSPAGAEMPGGSVKDLKDWLSRHAGRPVVVALWATWCVPCVEEMPTLNEAVRRFRGDGLEVLGVSVDSFTEENAASGRRHVEEFARRHRALWTPFYYDGDPDPLADAFGWPGPIPFTVVLGPDGAVRQRMAGSVPREVFLSRIREAIAARPAGDVGGGSPERKGH